MPVYVVSAKQPIRYDTITLQELGILRRLRQLGAEGGKIAVIELGERGPRICPVGKPEG